MAEPQFISGGYLLGRQVVRDDEYMSAELLPATFTSLSGCLVDFALDYWWSAENAAAAEAWGVARDRLPELVEWYRDRFDVDLGAPHVAYTRRVLEEFIGDFGVDIDGVVILGCGVSAGHAEVILGRHRTPEDLGEYGVFEMLEKGGGMEPGGTALGFELLSYQYGLEHSWICNSLEVAVRDELGITPDPQTGLIASFDDATRAAEYINRDDVGAEPGTWLPWLVVEYPIG